MDSVLAARLRGESRKTLKRIEDQCREIYAAREMAPELLRLLGFKPWGGIGATGEPHGDLIQRGEDSLGELYPAS